MSNSLSILKGDVVPTAPLPDPAARSSFPPSSSAALSPDMPPRAGAESSREELLAEIDLLRTANAVMCEQSSQQRTELSLLRDEISKVRRSGVVSHAALTRATLLWFFRDAEALAIETEDGQSARVFDLIETWFDGENAKPLSPAKVKSEAAIEDLCTAIAAACHAHVWPRRICRGCTDVDCSGCEGDRSVVELPRSIRNLIGRPPTVAAASCSRCGRRRGAVATPKDCKGFGCTFDDTSAAPEVRVSNG